MDKKVLLKRIFVKSFVIIGFINISCLIISFLFALMAIMTMAAGHQVADSAIETVVRGYFQFIIFNPIITILTIISVLWCFLFIWHQTRNRTKFLNRFYSR